jgi:hypothetical protein
MKRKFCWERMMEERKITLIYGAKDPDEVKQQVDTIWEILKNNPDILEDANIDPVTIEGETNPFSAERPAEGSAIVTGILIAAGGRLAGELLLRLWDQLIWPRLQTRIVGIRQAPPVS